MLNDEILKECSAYGKQYADAVSTRGENYFDPTRVARCIARMYDSITRLIEAGYLTNEDIESQVMALEAHKKKRAEQIKNDRTIGRLNLPTRVYHALAKCYGTDFSIDILDTMPDKEIIANVQGFSKKSLEVTREAIKIFKEENK